MNTKYAFPESAQALVYVKAVNVSDLPQEVQEEADGRDQLFAVHNADGEQLALVADRRMAFVLARQNDLSPVTVH
ncbi:DUF1150 family protein [Shimia ponticola]|uniref:DUF1150 family protein n=1 Tax=Shimia ponticola TaxID=2582893 RepID=UPI0011BEA3DE|nr:DUF1150 family protein [Shimia ponticola]